MKSGFLDKLIERLDKLDPESIQTQFLKLAQERGLLEMIFQSIQEGVIALDGRGRITYANRAAEHLMGFAFPSARGRPVSRFLRDIDWDRILRLDANEWSRLIGREIEITYPEHRFVNFYVVPMAAPGADTAAVVILRDVTRDRQNEATMLESERLNAVKLLAAGVAHEIGNPLNALNIHLQLLHRAVEALSVDEKDELQELVEVARGEVSRLDLVITQFLRALRPSQPELAPSQIDKLLQETLTLLKLEIENRSIEVEVEIGSAVPRIRVDRDQIKQAFFNLIRNAFQAMPDGGALRIAVSSSDKHVAVAFHDTGVGIKQEDLGRIFEPYHTTKQTGTGLGLMLVQRIVQDHGGQIEIVSKPGAGTVFTILLPLAERRIRLLEAPTAEGRAETEWPEWGKNPQGNHE